MFVVNNKDKFPKKSVTKYYYTRTIYIFALQPIINITIIVNIALVLLGEIRITVKNTLPLCCPIYIYIQIISSRRGAYFYSHFY